MAYPTKMQTFKAMEETGLVPLFYHPDVELTKRLIKACYDGGVRVFEFTNRGDYALNLFSELSQWKRRHCPDLLLGIGSIVDAPTAAGFIAQGADFIVSPILSEEVAILCNGRRMAWIPGCGSVTEIHRAYALGAEIVKIFPAVEVGGPEFIKAVRAPMPWASLMCTGGVAPEEKDLKVWFEAGAVCVGMGSLLFTKEALGGDFALISENIRTLIKTIKNIRESLNS